MLFTVTLFFFFTSGTYPDKYERPIGENNEYIKLRAKNRQLEIMILEALDSIYEVRPDLKRGFKDSIK